MLLSDIIHQAMDETNTSARTCAAALGLSPQNFGQRLARDSFDLEEASEILEVCGCRLLISYVQLMEV